MKFFKHVKGLTLAALALALLCIAFASTTKAQAKEIVDGVTAVYNTSTDTIDITAPNGTVIDIYSLKNADDALTAKSKKAYSKTVSGTSISISLSDKKAGVKVAENKPVYLYISAVSGAAIVDKTANFSLAPTDVKKITSVTFNYAKTYEGSTDTVLTVEYDNGGDEPVAADLALVVLADFVGKDKTASATYTGTAFNGGVLYGLVSDKDNTSKKKAIKHKLNVQIIGKSAEVTVAGTKYDGQRNSKVKSVSPKSVAKAPKAKVDYLKGTIALKSGFDYVVLPCEPASGSSIEAGAWLTILPISESGTATKSTMSSTLYTPIKKLTDSSTADEKAFFYNGDKKAKTLNLEEICDDAWKSNDSVSGTAVIYVRKTATDKAPASEATEAIVVTKPKDVPTITPVSGSAVLFATSDDKGKFASVKCISGANTGNSYEILVVKETTISKIDWSKVKWTKFDPTKGTKAKLSSKISYTDGTAAETVNALNSEGRPETGVVILIRGAGIKEVAKKGVVTTAGALPTKYATTKFVANGEKKIDWQIVQ